MLRRGDHRRRTARRVKPQPRSTKGRGTRGHKTCVPSRKGRNVRPCYLKRFCYNRAGKPMLQAGEPPPNPGQSMRRLTDSWAKRVGASGSRLLGPTMPAWALLYSELPVDGTANARAGNRPGGQPARPARGEHLRAHQPPTSGSAMVYRAPAGGPHQRDLTLRRAAPVVLTDSLTGRVLGSHRTGTLYKVDLTPTSLIEPSSAATA